MLLLEGLDRVLPTFVPVMSQKAAKALARLGVTVHTGAIVTDITDQSVTMKIGDKSETIPARTVLWAAGVLASPLARQLADATGARTDKAARVIVEPDLTLLGHPEIFRHRRHGSLPRSEWPALAGCGACGHSTGTLRGGYDSGTNPGKNGGAVPIPRQGEV